MAFTVFNFAFLYPNFTFPWDPKAKIKQFFETPWKLIKLSYGTFAQSDRDGLTMDT